MVGVTGCPARQVQDTKPALLEAQLDQSSVVGVELLSLPFRVRLAVFGDFGEVAERATHVADLAGHARHQVEQVAADVAEHAARAALGAHAPEPTFLAPVSPDGR